MAVENIKQIKPKQIRTRKPLTARTAGVKIAELVERLPPDQRDKAMALAKSLIEIA